MKSKRRNNFSKLGLLLLAISFSFTGFLFSQEDETFINIEKNCATNLGKEYMIKMGIFEDKMKEDQSINVVEILKGTRFKQEESGVFILSNFNSHSRKIILLKKVDKIKILTFSNISKSLSEFVSFLDESNFKDDDILKYLDLIKSYIISSRKKISTKKVVNSSWTICGN